MRYKLAREIEDDLALGREPTMSAPALANACRWRFHFAAAVVLGASLGVAAVPGFAASLGGRVVAVLDGDSVRVVDGTRLVEVRLRGIDCPERGQAFSRRARQATARLAYGTRVRVETAGTDRFGRTLGEVFLPDGRSLNAELVRAGWAWWYRRYSTDATLGELEAAARREHRGLWADPRPIPPWEFRHRPGHK